MLIDLATDRFPKQKKTSRQGKVMKRHTCPAIYFLCITVARNHSSQLFRRTLDLPRTYMAPSVLSILSLAFFIFFWLTFFFSGSEDALSKAWNQEALILNN